MVSQNFHHSVQQTIHGYRCTTQCAWKSTKCKVLADNMSADSKIQTHLCIYLKLNYTKYAILESVLFQTKPIEALVCQSVMGSKTCDAFGPKHFMFPIQTGKSSSLHQAPVEKYLVRGENLVPTNWKLRTSPTVCSFHWPPKMHTIKVKPARLDIAHTQICWSVV